MTVDSPLQPRPAPQRFSRRKLLAGGALSVAALGLYATEIERHFIEVVDQTFHIAGLPEAFHGFRIAQISDIHLEWFTEDFLLREAVRKVNALKPDLVLTTGDYITNNPSGPDNRAYAAMPHCGEILRGLKCPLRYSVLGNHDAHVDPAAVTSMLATYDMNPLVNRYVAIERGSQHIWISGLDDVEAGSPDIGIAVPEKPDAPVIMMCHEPDHTDAISRHPRAPHIDLVLSGHSHGGQVRMPLFGAITLPPLGEKYSMGRYRLGNIQLYVNRGLGTVGLPVRFDCPPEITHITLQPA
jgi:predicted MPP superfamily phosphohydrolase